MENQERDTVNLPDVMHIQLNLRRDDQSGLSSNRYVEGDNSPPQPRRHINQQQGNNEQNYNLASRYLHHRIQGLERDVETLSGRVENLTIANSNLERDLNVFKDRVDKLIAGNKKTDDHRKGSGISLELPTFGADPINDRPMRFLHSILNYCGLINLPVHCFKYVMEQALKGTARDWFEYVKPRVNTVPDFKSLFVARFWNLSVQSEVLHRLQFGSYETVDGNDFKKSEYAIRYFNDAMALAQPPTEETIVKQLSNHFSPRIQQEVNDQGVKSMDRLLELLDIID